MLVGVYGSNNYIFTTVFDVFVGDTTSLVDYAIFVFARPCTIVKWPCVVLPLLLVLLAKGRFGKGRRYDS